ncbi:MAG: PASTA domain-containing protein [Geminicoccaceae bacterium]
MALFALLPEVAAAPQLALPNEISSHTLQADHGGETGAVQFAQAAGTQQQRGPRNLGAVSNAVQVPSLQCLTPAEAETILRERRLRLGEVHQRPSNACGPGGIIAQSPPRGRTVGAGTTIEVVINPAAETTTTGVAIPEVLGLTPAEAQSQLRREGLDVGQIKKQSAPGPLGTIVAQSPEAGTTAARGSRVNIIVASEVRIPDLRTLNRDDVAKKLREFSLTLGRVTEESSSQPNGTVIKQWPLPGVPAATDDKVDITVAKGQTVPDLNALTLNEARTRLRDAGLRPGRVDSRVSDKRRGTIIEQKPAANTVVSPGVVIDVVLAATPIVPDLAGRTVDDARRLIGEQLLQVGSVTAKVSDKPQGTVIEQRPRASAEVGVGSSVDLVLAEGLEVPKLIGLSLENAGAELAKQLMRLGKVERRVVPDGNGRIVDQSPAPGAPGSFGVGIDGGISEPPTVPDLRGLTAEAVASKLAEKQLVLSDINYQLSSDQLDQTVLSQEPLPGSAIVNGGTISVVLAVTAPPPDRPDLVPVPKVTSMTAGQADQALKSAGLLLQLEGSQSSDRPSRVTGQAPDAGRLIPIGTQVVAQLEAIDEVVVPDLSGVQVDTVDARLADAFLALGRQEWRLSNQPDGTVINQNPPPGTPVSFGNAVDLVFSASSLIPDLTGLTPEEARPVLTSQSLRLESTREIFSLRWPGTIVDQIPEANSPARVNSAVRVDVVGLAGPLTAGGTLILALAGLVWFRARQAAGPGMAGAGTTPTPPPVYGISRSAAPRPAFDKTARAARPKTAPVAAPAPPQAVQSEADYAVHVDPGTQVIQTDEDRLVKSSIRLRGRTDRGEQTLAID